MQSYTLYEINSLFIGSITENYKMSSHPTELIFFSFKCNYDQFHCTL